MLVLRFKREMWISPNPGRGQGNNAQAHHTVYPSSFCLLPIKLYCSMCWTRLEKQALLREALSFYPEQKTMSRKLLSKGHTRVPRSPTPCRMSPGACSYRKESTALSCQRFSCFSVTTWLSVVLKVLFGIGCKNDTRQRSEPFLRSPLQTWLRYKPMGI